MRVPFLLLELMMKKFDIVTDPLEKHCFNISYNGVVDINSYTSPELPVAGALYDDEIIREILELPIYELGKEVIILQFKSNSLDFNLYGYEQLEFTTPKYYDSNYRLVISLHHEPLHWVKPYSIYDYWKAIANEIKKISNHNISMRNDSNEDDDYLNGIDIVINISDTDWTIQSYLNEYLPICKNMINCVVDKLSQPRDGFSIEFDFPNEIKAPCEQYLMYFAQFMMDLGVKVNSEISHKGQSTILSVIPENQDEALSNIKDALSAYVNLPQENINAAFDPSKDIAVAQLEFNVNNLNNQLLLVKSTMIAYEHTIQAQKIALDAFQIKEQPNTLLLSKEPEKEDDIEPVFGKLFQVKKYDKNGVVIDYPELVRALKRKFS